MPELTFGLHAWPGHPAAVVKSAVMHAVESAAGGHGIGAVHVKPVSPYAAYVKVQVAPNVSGAVTRAVESALGRLRDPALRRRTL
jgi:hypothetical protein